MSDKEQAKELFDAEDNFTIKKKNVKSGALARSNEAENEGADSDDDSAEGKSSRFDVKSLFSEEVPETRSEVVGSVRLKPSTRKKLKKIVADEIRRGRKVSETSLISEILEKIL
ncbi:MAG TPA: hypothetical protein VFO10_18135 [Oligoflexus sp.]|uniref:hypothetical protein n=1 Tax=Oligoflexus sp. TaxID=1971216 RepID=UPI002D7FB125|nr:hypothetical protein [Oligoflexus sp.]HET9239185.1 hypothetical protein [Oligoflexus sp.]